jgi:hypothetical protein
MTHHVVCSELESDQPPQRQIQARSSRVKYSIHGYGFGMKDLGCFTKQRRSVATALPPNARVHLRVDRHPALPKHRRSGRHRTATGRKHDAVEAAKS